jgi:hypothetical protein
MTGMAIVLLTPTLEVWLEWQSLASVKSLVQTPVLLKKKKKKEGVDTSIG